MLQRHSIISWWHSSKSFGDKPFTDKHTSAIGDPIKPTMSQKLADIPSSKSMSASIVDFILLKESSRTKQSKTGTS